METILLQAEVLDLKANPNRPAEGAVIEAKLERAAARSRTVLVQRGTLKRATSSWPAPRLGPRPRPASTTQGEQLDEAGPSVPVEVLGLDGAPEAGDRLAVVENEARARELTEYRARKKRERRPARAPAARNRSNR